MYTSVFGVCVCVCGGDGATCVSKILEEGEVVLVSVS